MGSIPPRVWIIALIGLRSVDVLVASQLAIIVGIDRARPLRVAGVNCL